jgi:hypothetical protein
MKTCIQITELYRAFQQFQSPLPAPHHTILAVTVCACAKDHEPEIAPLKETPFDSAVVGVPHAASGLGFDVPLFHGRRRRRY